MNPEWTIAPRHCSQCSDYVPQLTRCRDCGGPWLCDECSEAVDCGHYQGRSRIGLTRVGIPREGGFLARRATVRTSGG